MLYLAENLRKLRMMKNLTQEDIAAYLHITPQSVSKWERSETYPDITLLPALANILETSIDLLLGMDTIRAAETRYNIHKTATEHMRKGDLDTAETIYRDALLLYPNKPGMLLGLAAVLALKDLSAESIALIEKGLPLSDNEKQKATMRAVLCFLYAGCGDTEKAERLASSLPHARECREVIEPVIQQKPDHDTLHACIQVLLLGES
ncbi:MAG: helix-turn-helix transcriptional regulator [Ruminococcaceae bacterium]|nr:helix-turn-helix transcriptional regulator [Oscillospiraceae bacterium]